MNFGEIMFAWILLVILAMLYLWIFRNIRQLKHDRLRFGLFAIRDELYLLLARGELKNTDPLFMGLRGYINSTLRWTEKIAVHEFLASVPSVDEMEKSPPKFNQLLDGYPESLESQLKDIVSKTGEATLAILVYNSNILRSLKLVTDICSIFSTRNRPEKEKLAHAITSEKLPKLVKESTPVRRAQEICETFT